MHTTRLVLLMLSVALPAAALGAQRVAAPVAPPMATGAAAPKASATPAVPTVGRDPFIPSPDPQRAAPAEPPPIFSAEVTAVMLAGAKRYATLRVSPTELRVVEVGQSVGRWRVVAITPTSVQAVTSHLGSALPVTLPVKRAPDAAVPASATTTLSTTALPGARVGADIPLLPPPSTKRPDLPPPEHR